MTSLVIGALNGVSKSVLLETSGGYVPHGIPSDYWTKVAPLTEEILLIVNGSFRTRDPPLIRASGYVVSSLEAALWAFHHSTSFEHGCLLAVNLGDDADTVAAIYGYLAGAYYGIESIPQRWKDALALRPLIHGIATELYNLVLLLSFPATKLRSQSCCLVISLDSPWNRIHRGHRQCIIG
jgi:ADP-ribosyl-[dinitrogen reductase] hydrolase